MTWQSIKLIIVLTYSFLLFCALFIFSCGGRQTTKGAVIARVDNQKLTSQNIDSVFSFFSLDNNNLPALIEAWIDNTVLYEAAVVAGFNNDKSLIKRRDDFYRDLVVSSFLSSESERAIRITKEAVRSYYEANKGSFVRKEEEVSVNHYTTLIKGVGKTLRKEILQGKGLTPDTTSFTRTLKSIKKGRLIKELETPLFSSRDRIVGPIRTADRFHLFKIINRYKKGSQKTLSESYDEIYQRLYKQKAFQVSELILDSLKQTLNIYINPEYQ